MKKTFLEWVRECNKPKIKIDGIFEATLGQYWEQQRLERNKKSEWDQIDPSLAKWIPNAPFEIIGSHTLSKEHRAYIIVDRVENVVGRGKVLIIDLIKNKLTEDNYIDEIPFEKGDSITTDLGKFVIKNIEFKRNLMNYKISSTIGILV